MKRIALIVVGLALVVPALTVAQPKPEVQLPPTQEYFFSPTEVGGKRDDGGGIIVAPKPTVIFRNLIQLRGDFKPELLDSLHEL